MEKRQLILERLKSLDKETLINIYETIHLYDRQKKYNVIENLYPDTGPLRRDLYQKHIKFFNNGLLYRERLMLAANRIGKTFGIGGYETVLHLTGRYPEWWRGRTFKRPVKCLVAGDTSKTVKEIIQEKLFGGSEHGTGLIPKSCIQKVIPKPNVPDAIEKAYIKHVSGGLSQIYLKSYEQGRESFQGTEYDVVWLDEEPPLNIYIECLMRTMTTNGLVLLTFTPINGLSDVLRHFLNDTAKIEGEHGKSRYVMMASWDDVPHLDNKAKEELMMSIPEYQREARMKGRPVLGSGVVYPINEDDIKIDDFEIPGHWHRGFGMDVGWNKTAVIWGALDPETDVLYLYSEYYAGKAEPVIHAEAIKSRGEWIIGVIDPSANNRSQKDGERLMELYRTYGLRLNKADNVVEAGIFAVWQRLSSGRLKIFKSLVNWFDEFRLYRRNEDGKIIKEHDHLMDSTRYLVMSGLKWSYSQDKVRNKARKAYDYINNPYAWMGG